MTGSIVVVGASHAAVQAIDTLHREGHGSQVVLIGDESEPPYNRPPLSKKYFTGELARERLQLRSAQFYEHGGVTMRLGVRVTAIDRAAQRLRLSDGGELAWEKLLLCVGSRARRLDVPGADLQGIHYLRTMADVDGYVRTWRSRAGWWSSARDTLVSRRQPGPSSRARSHRARSRGPADAARRLSGALQFTRCEREGVRIHCNVAVSGFTGDGRVQHVLCGAQEFPADVVITGVGIAPDVTLAAAAGLKCDNGIWVDESCRTSDPNVYAAGDCTNHPSVHYGRRIRLESVDNAVEQGRVAASAICGKDVRHDHVPWFWSDQYDVKLQIAGLSQGHDQTVVRGEPGGGHFAIYYLSQGELIAVDAINSPKDFMSGRRWIAERRHPDAAKLADPGVDLKSF
jgi:3-phenylpropionate/trans-cinnamate dioxygenase ferredoxin reductase subunit